jgi:hypothetical protein
MKDLYPIRMDICSDTNYKDILVNMYSTDIFNWSDKHTMRVWLTARWFSVMLF